MAEALYRKYRPQIFEDVVGQEHIERTIKNAIGSNKVSHAYLFCGPRGTGKTTTARLVAKALLCQDGPTPEPDGTCDNCLAVACGEHPDVYELDAASRTGVENVREEIISRVQFAPTKGRYKVYIIDEVHMLSQAAFNALLKTLEEPPSHIVFILCTTDSHKVPETIHSRCQRFDFHRISSEAIVTRLGAICVAEEVEFEGDALELIAHRAEGGMRNALTSLEQLIAFGEGNVTLELAERLLGSIDHNDLTEIMTAIADRDVATCFKWTAQFAETGADLAQFVRDLAEHVRNLYIMTLSGSEVILDLDEAGRRELMREKDMFGADRLARMLGLLGDLSNELKTATNPRLSFEITLTRLVRPDSDLTLESLAERIEALERSGIPVSSVRETPRANEGTPVQETVPDLGQAVTDEQIGQPVAWESQSAVEPSFEEAPVQHEPVCAPSHEAPAAQPCSPDEAGLENPAALQRVWKTVLQRVKGEKTAYGVLFLNTKVTFDAQDKQVVIEFPAENVFAFSAVQKPDVRQLLFKAFREAVGYEVGIRFAQMKTGEVLPERRSEPAFSETAPSASAQERAHGESPQPREGFQDAQDGFPEEEAVPVDLYGASGTFDEDEVSPLTPATSAQSESQPDRISSDESEGRQEKGGEPDEDVKALLTNVYGDIVFEEIDD